MGVKSFFQELKTKVSPSRMFKALVTESTDIVPKVTSSIESIELVEGNSVAPGCVLQTNFPEGAHFKYLKNRIDEVDPVNYVVKYTLVEGDVLGDKFEKICYDLKFEAAEDGGCVVKVTSEYHTKGDYELSDEEVKAGKEQALGLYKACEDYLLAHPDVCT